MERKDFLRSTAIGSLALGTSELKLSEVGAGQEADAGTRKILIAGGGFDTSFIRYMAELTGKDRPRICYLPTATADSDSSKVRFFQLCAPLNVEPHVQEMFISSYRMDESWEDVFLSMDGIVVSGGNTLNQQAIWRAQGVDVVLREAWDQGIVLGGASAGSLCWFEEGTTDSRPRELTKIECLGFLEGSHSPHYDGEAQRRPTYHELIRTGVLKPGYACDNNAGIFFQGNDVKRVVATREGAKCYYVHMAGGTVVEDVLEPERIA